MTRGSPWVFIPHCLSAQVNSLQVANYSHGLHQQPFPSFCESSVSDVFLIPVVVSPSLAHTGLGENFFPLGKSQQELQVFLAFDNANSFTADVPPSLLHGGHRQKTSVSHTITQISNSAILYPAGSMKHPVTDIYSLLICYILPCFTIVCDAGVQTDRGCCPLKMSRKSQTKEITHFCT